MNTYSTTSRQSSTGLAAFFTKIYSLMGMGLGLSAFVAGLMLYVFPENMIAIMNKYPMVYMGATFLNLGLVFVVSNAARKNSLMAMPIFLIYSALNGFSLSFILARYAQATVFLAFISSALMFFVMAIIGTVIKKDLSGMGKAMMAALIGILIASLINIFLRSNMMSYLISIVSVVIFSGIIARDNQMIKNVYHHTGGQVSDGWATSMALSLYLDFINLFLNILRLMGRLDNK